MAGTTNTHSSPDGEESARTHRDHVDHIGGTAATASGFMERRWNRYYHATYERLVHSMLAGEGRADGTILDVGTSHGNWFRFLRRQGFGRVIGVEIDAQRAELARRAGYDEVFNCDASDLPLEDGSVQAAVSNDVFVHILQPADKVAVLREVRRALAPGGVFILNHTSARAIGQSAFHIAGHCSYVTLDGFLKLADEAGGYAVEDIKPTYCTCLGAARPSFLRHLMVAVPFGWRALYLHDGIRRDRPVDLADSVYLKLRATS